MDRYHPIIHPKHEGKWVAHRGKRSDADPLADIRVQVARLQAAAQAILDDVQAITSSAPVPPAPAPQPVPSPAPAPSPTPGGVAEPQWPSFPGGAQFIGQSTEGVSVWVDPALGDPGLQNAKNLLANADFVMTANTQIFGTPNQGVNVIVYALNDQTDGTGGADHMACDFINGGNIEVDASFGSSLRCYALFEAELSECSMNGQLCGLSTGEALSRWCASAVSRNALSDFATAPTWALDGYPNWVDQTEPTDQNPDSIGCGMAFISWMISRGASLPTIAQAMVALGDSGTLAQLYEKLNMGRAVDAWMTFRAALPATITSDDPFGSVMVAMTAKPHHRGA